MTTADSQDTPAEREVVAEKECFVILPIGAGNAEVKRRSDHVFKYVVTQTVEPLGYSVVRADKIDRSGAITTQIIEHLLSASVIIADLSDLNPNVFYELGVLHAFRRPFVQVMAKGQTLPFDVQSLRTVFVDITDLDSVHEAKNELYAMIKSIEKGDETDTPIHHTANLQSLKSSESSESRAIAEIVDEITGLKRIMSRRLRPASSVNAVDHDAMKRFIEYLAKIGGLEQDDLNVLVTAETSDSHDSWAQGLNVRGPRKQAAGDDPWSTAPTNAAGPASRTSVYDEEPPF